MWEKTHKPIYSHCIIAPTNLSISIKFANNRCPPQQQSWVSGNPSPRHTKTRAISVKINETAFYVPPWPTSMTFDCSTIAKVIILPYFWQTSKTMIRARAQLQQKALDYETFDASDNCNHLGRSTTRLTLKCTFPFIRRSLKASSVPTKRVSKKFWFERTNNKRISSLQDPKLLASSH